MTVDREVASTQPSGIGREVNGIAPLRTIVPRPRVISAKPRDRA